MKKVTSINCPACKQKRQDYANMQVTCPEHTLPSQPETIGILPMPESFSKGKVALQPKKATKRVTFKVT